MGEHVDSKNIKKHKNDVFRLAQVIALDTRQMVSAEILEDMKQFLGLVENDNVDLKTIGIKEISYKTMIELHIDVILQRINTYYFNNLTLYTFSTLALAGVTF